MKNLSFATRDQARAFASRVNANVTAKIKQPVKGDQGRWIFPGLNHGGKLTLAK